MTFADIYNEVVNLRFNNQATKLAQVKKWVNQAEIALWNAADWEFKRVPAANVTVTSGAAAEPSDFGKALRLYDTYGFEVPYLEPDDFEEQFTAPVPAVTGNAEAYTVINRQIIVGPAQSGTFKLAYRRRYAHKDLTDAVTAGVMSVDTDKPLWDSEHHYILVPWAMRLGETMEADPTARSLETIIGGLKEMSMFEAMREELVGGVAEQVAVWGVG